MFNRCEYCGSSVEVEINFDQRQGTVALCQCEGAFDARVQEQRLRFQRKAEANRAAREPKTKITPRKLR